MLTTSAAPPIIIGLGCSSAATADEVSGLVAQCLAEAQRDASQILAFATHSRKRHSLALAQVAARYEVPLRFLDDHDLARGVPGTCEAVAAAAGPLLLTKRKSRFATCAIATTGAGFELSSFGQPPSASAVIAASTLVTSWAGP